MACFGINSFSELGARISAFFRIITVEPILMSWIFTSGSSIFLTNMIMDRVCHINLNETSHVCDHIDDHEHVKEQIQIHTAYISTYRTVAQQIPAIIACLFIGPWSDLHGRKKPMLFCQFGMILNMGCILLLVSIGGMRAEFFIIPPFLEGLTGGYMAILMLACSYICDVTTLKQRTFRMTCIYISQTVGSLLGTLLMTQIYHFFGNQILFSVACGCLVLAFLYTMVRIENTIPEQKEKKESDGTETQCRKCMNFTGLTHMGKNFMVLAKKRPGYGRIKINLLVAAMLLSCFSLGEGFLFAELKFDWDAEYYSYFSLFASCCSITGKTVGMFILTKVLKLKDSVIGILGLVIDVVATTIHGAAWAPWVLWFECALSAFTMFTSIIIRSMMSKVIPSSEVGAVFAALAAMESVLPMLMSSMANSIYAATLEFQPGVVYWASLPFMFAVIFLFVWFLRIEKKEKKLGITTDVENACSENESERAENSTDEHKDKETETKIDVKENGDASVHR